MSSDNKPVPLKHLVDLPPLGASEKNAFVAAQYEEVRREVMDRLKELWALEKFAFLGAAGIAAWLFTNAKVIEANAPMAWWLPLIFIITCLARFLAGMRHLEERTSLFLIQIEQRYLGEGGGWEQWFSTQAPNETYAFSLAWGVAVVFAGMLPLLQTGVLHRMLKCLF